MSGKAAAVALAQRWGLHDVAPADLRELAERGLIRAILPGDWPLYDVENFTAVEELRRIGDERRAWWAASINRWDAAVLMGVNVDEFDALAARHGLLPGRSDRYRRSEVLALRHERARP
jgi:hypothetical protein